MPTEIIMPKVDMVMETGTFVEWLKKEGETIKQSEPLFVIMTDKSAIEVEAPANGTLAGLTAKPDDVIPVSGVIGYILGAGETLPVSVPKPAVQPAVPAPAPAPAVAAPSESAKAPPSQPAAAPAGEAALVRATPLARSLARELGIDLNGVKGRGPQGRIYRADIEEYSKAAPLRPSAAGIAAPGLAAPAIDLSLPRAAVRERIPLKGPRAIIARRMAYSAATIPHIYETVDVDMSEVIRLREKVAPIFQENLGQKPSYTAILIRAVAKTLPNFPYLNSTLSGDEVILWEDIHIGVATDLEEYLIVPVIREVQNKNLEGIVQELSRLTEAAHSKHLDPKDMTGSTFTISNLGMYGISHFTAIINPPEAAILAVGAMGDTPRGINGEVVLRPIVNLTLGVDHRVTDGAYAARFLTHLKGILENPYLLI